MHINDNDFMKILEHAQNSLLTVKGVSQSIEENSDPLHYYNTGHLVGMQQGRVDMLEFLLDEFGEP